MSNTELVSLMLRLSLGLFFAFSGYHKLFNDQRRASLKATFVADGVYKPAMMYVIPLGEGLGGMALLLGFLTPVAALGLVAICLGACAFDGRKRVTAEAPLDTADRVDDWLYLPEFLYIVMLTSLALIGAGSFSVDALLTQVF